APLGFGDSYAGLPIVGTTASLVEHLAPGFEGRLWETSMEAVAGADAPLVVGDTFTPAHGRRAVEEGVHDDILTVVGKMPRTGTPWDASILVPIESVWEVHGLANGHSPANQGQLGAPFDARFFPGAGAIIVVPRDPVSAYRIQQHFTGEGVMAFFPGAVLSRLHGLLGDVRGAMSVMAVAAQTLVGASVLLTLVILTRLMRRQTAVLRALGAPPRFVMATIWGYAMGLVSMGAILGLALGVGAAALLGAVVEARTGLAISPRLTGAEGEQVAIFFALTSIFALIPAALAARAPIVPGLRS
ncbi:MAG: ABC transporter permease, partial [Shimia sp.]